MSTTTKKASRMLRLSISLNIVFSLILSVVLFNKLTAPRYKAGDCLRELTSIRREEWEEKWMQDGWFRILDVGKYKYEFLNTENHKLSHSIYIKTIDAREYFVKVNCKTGEE